MEGAPVFPKNNAPGSLTNTMGHPAVSNAPYHTRAVRDIVNRQRSRLTASRGRPISNDAEISIEDIAYQRILRALENDGTFDHHLSLIDNLSSRKYGNLVVVACGKSANTLDRLTLWRARNNIYVEDLLRGIVAACKNDRIDVLECLERTFPSPMSRLANGFVRNRFEPLSVAYVYSSWRAYDWLAERNLGVRDLPQDAHSTRSVLLETARANEDEYLISKIN